MTRTLQFTVQPEHDGLDIRTYVRRVLDFSARILTALKYEGEILLNGTHARSVDRVQSGDTLTLTLFDEAGEYEASEVPLTVLYEDEDFFVMHKPAGMPVHPSPGHDNDSVLNAAAWYFRAEENFTFRPLYRLDKDTTGVLVLAKNKFAACAALDKRYIAVCKGTVPESGRIEKPIGLKPGHSIQRCAGVGQPAVTEYERLATDGAYSLVRFHLLTGRTHQIRVHMADLGFPVVGDDLYGGPVDITAQQLLCCAHIHIVCPALQTDRTVCSGFSQAQKALFPNLF